MLTIVCLFAINAMILPSLISAKSDEAVIAGITIIFAEVFIAICIAISQIVKHNPELNKKKENE